LINIKKLDIVWKCCFFKYFFFFLFFISDYTFERLGNDEDGELFSVISERDGKISVMKVLRKVKANILKELMDTKFKKIIDLIKSNKYIVEIVEYFTYFDNLCIIMECCNNDNLQKKLLDKNKNFEEWVFFS
jgi:hypothetical protein